MAYGNECTIGTHYPDYVTLVDTWIGMMDGTRKDPWMETSEALLFSRFEIYMLILHELLVVG